MSNNIHAVVETAQEGVDLKVFRPGYDPGRIVITNDSLSFHCHFHLSPGNALQLSDALLAEALAVEQRQEMREEPREVSTRRENEMLIVERTCMQPERVRLRYDASGMHCYFNFSAHQARTLSTVLVEQADAADQFAETYRGVA